MYQYDSLVITRKDLFPRKVVSCLNVRAYNVYNVRICTVQVQNYMSITSTSSTVYLLLNYTL